jgi:muconolactone delta-isomerase
MSDAYQFMADFTLPDEPTEEFFDLLPYQDTVVQKYISEGKLINYALSLENAKLWAIFNASSEMEVLEMITRFPLARFMQVEISLLNVCNFSEMAPGFSLN